MKYIPNTVEGIRACEHELCKMLRAYPEQDFDFSEAVKLVGRSRLVTKTYERLAYLAEINEGIHEIHLTVNGV